MHLREIFEAEGKTAVFAFGRMNPPTIGHKKLVDKMAGYPGDHYIFLTHTQKPKTDPLSFAEKVFFARRSFGSSVIVGNENVKTIIQAMQHLQEKGYNRIIYLAGSDRVESFTKLLNTYNGKDYQFDKIDVASAGERDPDAEGAEGMSASKLKAAAAAGDFDEFKTGVAGDEKLAQMMYNKVRSGMGINESIVLENPLVLAPLVPIAGPVIGQVIRELGRRGLQMLGGAAMGKAVSTGINVQSEVEQIAPGLDADTTISVENYDDAIQRIARNPLPKFEPSSDEWKKYPELDKLIAALIGFLGENLLRILIGAGLSLLAIYAIAKTIKYFKKRAERNELKKSIQDELRGYEKDEEEKQKEDVDLDELNLFKSTNNASVKEQDPNKLKVLDWIADRADGKEHFLSFYRKGAAWSGRLLFIKPEAAAKFRRKVEDNPEQMDRVKQALTNIETTSKLFANLGIKHDVRRAD